MNDADLRQLFHQLRDEELSRVPSPRMGGVEPALSDAERREAESKGAPKGRMRGWALAIVIITVVAIATMTHHRRPPVTESIVTWKAPTDFLLQTPGSELLSTVPQIPERK
jgi:hypothetical protein